MLTWFLPSLLDRDSEREEPYNSSQPESTPKHRHRRSRSDNSDWPAVEEYGMPNQIPEQSPSPGLGRRQQSYTGFPAGMTSDVSRSLSSRDKAPGIGANGDPRFIDERMYGTNVRGHRRESYPASKVRLVSRVGTKPWAWWCLDDQLLYSCCTWMICDPLDNLMSLALYHIIHPPSLFHLVH